jgi:hypothetical protein
VDEEAFVGRKRKTQWIRSIKLFTLLLYTAILPGRLATVSDILFFKVSYLLLSKVLASKASVNLPGGMQEAREKMNANIIKFFS